ncbi:PTS sugar transporter subunit IIC [Vibrio mangrovi]|uniref:Permease IIC component n=1 Tax=Vibrio mangrovi TaxID=474394 RepID=A0A1Y6IT19_9VIBR|nr:PTS sugar transporter subunit IIC [Vibrio mangrovi]MDW6004486.1 PTS sugar transporter subunit IIC [Vibrio mangrovi]SMS00774.1 Lichenan permease IIC component [Vibrio mangrovi]
MSLYSAVISFIERKIAPIAGKIGGQHHVLAVRDGFISAMPFMIVGSFLLIFAFPPFAKDTTFAFGQMWVQFALENKETIMMPFRMTMGVMTMYIAVGIGQNLAQNYKLDPLMGGLLSLCSFLLVAAPVANGGIPAAYLGGTGIFTAIITSLYSIELMNFLKKKNLTIRLPEQVPEKIARSFELLVPVAIMIATLYPLSLMLKSATGMILPELIMNVFKPLVSASDSLLAILICVAISHLLWFCGIHGAAIVTNLLQPFWLANLAANQSALELGQALPHVFVDPFWRFYIVIGGCGSTFTLVLMYLRSRSAHLRSIGKLSLIPAIFNINEPVIFGSPLVMNPIMLIPFVGIPLVNATVAWFALSTGLVDKFISVVPWTTPSLLGASWAAGWSVGPVILVLINFCISFILWMPFYKTYEKQLLAEEAPESVEAPNNTESSSAKVSQTQHN